MSAPANRRGDTDVDRALARLSLLPTSERPLLWRSTAEGGYTRFVHLPAEQGTRTLARLAKSNNVRPLVERALAALACDPPDDLSAPPSPDEAEDEINPATLPLIHERDYVT